MFEEMEKSRQIVKIEKLTESWRDWGINIISFPLTNVLKRIWRSEESAQRYVVLSVLEVGLQRRLYFLGTGHER